MILVDTSVWIDHFSSPIQRLADLLAERQVLTHPYIIGEIAMGSPPNRATLLRRFANLPGCSVALPSAVLIFIEANSLFGRGIGYIDAHLLAATVITAGARLWAHDLRLERAAGELGIEASR